MFKKVIGWFKALFTKEVAREVKKTMVATTSAGVNGLLSDPANRAAARAAVIAVAKDGLDGNHGVSRRRLIRWVVQQLVDRRRSRGDHRLLHLPGELLRVLLREQRLEPTSYLLEHCLLLAECRIMNDEFRMAVSSVLRCAY